LKQLGFTVLSKHIGKKMADSYWRGIEGKPPAGSDIQKSAQLIFFFIFSLFLLTSRQKERKSESKKEKKKRQKDNRQTSKKNRKTYLKLA
jgi:hypothetical protein